jgi:enoyl-CoA hydratase
VTDDTDILFERRGALGLVTLNRPQALNTLTHAMCVRLHAQLDFWEKDPRIATVAIQGEGERAFCAGGDLRALYHAALSNPDLAARYWRDEYLLNIRIRFYPKPFVALLKGFVMGGGAGVSVHGSHCVVDETVRFAMPETAIGLFVDVGGSYFLPRLRGKLGLYLALTGTRLGAADCLFAQVARYFVPAANTPELIARLSAGLAPERALGELAGTLPPAPLEAIADKIDAAFSAHSVDEIGAQLRATQDAWSRAAYSAFCLRSPTSQKIAFRQLALGGELGFCDCMRMEYRICQRIVLGHDFYEGVRATIFSKEVPPRWQPARLDAVRDEDIAAYFAPVAQELLP